MKTWADFYDFCHADVPGVSTFAAERELRRAAQEFFEKTKCWKAELAPVYLFPKVELYDLEVPKGATIVKILEAKDDAGNDVNLLTQGDGRAGLLFVSQLQFEAVPIPTSRMIVKMRAVLMPDHAAAGIEDGLFNQYAEVIARGAKARLYAQPQKTYTDDGRAESLQRQFELAIAREKVAAAKGFSNAALRTKPQFL
jgi:hypothetical protein